MSLESDLLTLNKELLSEYNEIRGETLLKSDSKRIRIISNIERIILGIMDSISKGEGPVIQTIYHNEWNNCYFSERLKKNETIKKLKKIKFSNATSRSKFAIIVFLLSKIHKLLTTNQTNTRRELYYKNFDILKSQKQVDDSMKDVCYMLDTPSWDLGVLATSKGIVHGPLVLYMSDGDAVDCSKTGGVPVPSNVLEVEKMSTTATWVLIVEKDAAFQQLITANITETLNSCIVITGKGYPDINTRMLVCKFWQYLKIPILALVDADPHGFEIMCVYRFGSVSMSSYSDHLACPSVRWLGIHPSDIQPLILDSKILSLKEIKKVNQLITRAYIENNENLKNQLEVLLQGNVKAEIEAVTNISPNFLIEGYIKNKIAAKDYF